MKPTHVLADGTPIKRMSVVHHVTKRHIQYAIHEMFDWQELDESTPINKKNIVDHIKNTFFIFGHNLPELFTDFTPSKQVNDIGEQYFPEFYNEVSK